jgi:alpha-1,2-mannosyltransferase
VASTAGSVRPVLTGLRPTPARRWAAAAIMLALAGHALVLAVWPAAHTLLIDLQVYAAGGEHVLHGRPLYDGGVLLTLPFVYPPFAALLFVPLSLLPVGVLKAVWTALTLLLLGYVVQRSRPGPLLATVAFVALATWLDPVRTTLYLGQINVLVMALVVGDLLGRRESRWRGVGIGLAAALKLTPLLFVAYLLVTRRFRAAATALGTFVAAAGLGFLVDPVDSAVYWLRGTFAAADRISDVSGASNHSLNGLVARVAGPAATPVYVAGAVLLVAVTLVLAARAHRVGEEVLAVTLCGLCSAAVAPFSWSHHWVWVVPLVVALGWRAVEGARAAAWLLAGVLVPTVAVVTALPGAGVGPIPSTGLISLLPDAYLLLFLAVLVVAAAVLYRPRHDEGPAS